MTFLVHHLIVFNISFHKVEQNQEFQGLVCEGANVLPTKFIEDAFRDGYGAFFSCFSFLFKNACLFHFSRFLMLDLPPLMCQVMQEKLSMSGVWTK